MYRHWHWIHRSDSRLLLHLKNLCPQRFLICRTIFLSLRSLDYTIYRRERYSICLAALRYLRDSSSFTQDELTDKLKGTRCSWRDPDRFHTLISKLSGGSESRSCLKHRAVGFLISSEASLSLNIVLIYYQLAISNILSYLFLFEDSVINVGRVVVVIVKDKNH